MTLAADLAPAADTMGTLVASATSRLEAAGIDTARLDAEVLLAEACGSDRTALYAAWRRTVPDDCRVRFDVLLTRRLTREPLQYIVGRQEFWSLDFAVSPAVLIPRPESELLVELALRALASSSFPRKRESIPAGGTPPPSRMPNCAGMTRLDAAVDGQEPPFVGGVSTPVPSPGEEGARNLLLCDLGTGSGCLAVALAHELPRATVWALDLSPAALAVAAANARRHHVAERIHLVHSDLFAAAGDLRFDALVSNPPYIRSDGWRRLQPELAWEPAHALYGGTSGLTVIERVLEAAPGRLRPGGWLIMEIDDSQGPAVERRAHTAGFSAVSVVPDYTGRPRALLARR